MLIQSDQGQQSLLIIVQSHCTQSLHKVPLKGHGIAARESLLTL
jgi:hypothetical protein